MAQPIVKWVGGKVRLVSRLTELLPPGAADLRHVEPFAGGASFYFSRAPRAALLADTNASLIEMYRAVRDRVDDVVAVLRGLDAAHDAAHYYTERERFNRGDYDAATGAALMVYLNHTCFNGLWRVNSKGEFNVPLGDYKRPAILDEPRLREASAALQGVDLRVQDFGATCAACGAGDFVYLDPPYAPAPEATTKSFDGYAPGGFNHDEHIRLRDAFRDMAARGARCMLSNSNTEFARDIYRDFRITKVDSPRSISRAADGRSGVVEIVVRSW